MRKILIIGCCGAGKSTLSKQLSQQLDLPLYHLDQLWWRPGWKHIERDEFDRQLHEILLRSAWIIDGNFLRTLPERLRYADTVIFLDYSCKRCLWQTVKRFLFRNRQDKLPGCAEQLDVDFIRFVWNFRQTVRPQILTSLTDFSGNSYIFRTPKELNSALKQKIFTIVPRSGDFQA